MAPTARFPHSSSQRGPPFGHLFGKSFEDNHCHHHPHHQQPVQNIQEEVYKHFPAPETHLRVSRRFKTCANPSNEDLFSDVFWRIPLRKTNIIIAIMTIIITTMHYTHKGMFLSTLAVGQAQSGLSRAAQRTLLLPTRTSLRTSLGRR